MSGTEVLDTLIREFDMDILENFMKRKRKKNFLFNFEKILPFCLIEFRRRRWRRRE